jgi:hypothetical protein
VVRELRATAPMNKKLFLFATALVEVGTGAAVLFVPTALIPLLLGIEQTTDEARLLARIAGAALLGIGIASWVATTEASNPAQRGLFTGILVYNVGVSTLLAFASAILHTGGPLLWPVVILHSGLSIWCLSCLWHLLRSAGH